MEVTRNSETAQRMAPKFCMYIPMQLLRTRARSHVDRVHHLEENWNFKTMFPSRSSNCSKIKIVDRPTSGCEPAAVCNTAGAVAAVPTDRATVSAYQASVNNNNNQAAARRTLCRRDAMTWAGANVPYGVILALTINTCSLAYQLYLPSCGGCEHMWLL